MTTDVTTGPAARVSTLSTAELVAIVAALMSLNALAIDIMLPAMGQVASDLNVTVANDQQLVIIAYVLGFGFPQLGFGPLADRFGRRPVLGASLVGYTAMGFACVEAPTFTLLLAARFIHGVFAAGCRVVAVAVVRDLFAGRAMARVMSLVMTVFMIVPILAPGLGQVVLAFGHWRWCFGVLALAGSVVGLWVALRLPETLPVERRRELGVGEALQGYGAILRSRPTFGYTLAGGTVFGALFAFLSTSEQLFREVLGVGEHFGLWFAGVALTMAGTNFANARLVERFGMRRISHIALLTFSGSSLLLYGLTTSFEVQLWFFYPLFIATFALFGLIGSNFNALAMQPLGKVAGSAAAAYGFATTTLSALLGGMIGRFYDGTPAPLVLGFALLGLSATAVVLFVERGRLFVGD